MQESESIGEEYIDTQRNPNELIYIIIHVGMIVESSTKFHNKSEKELS